MVHTYRGDMGLNYWVGMVNTLACNREVTTSNLIIRTSWNMDTSINWTPFCGMFVYYSSPQKALIIRTLFSIPMESICIGRFHYIRTCSNSPYCAYIHVTTLWYRPRTEGWVWVNEVHDIRDREECECVCGYILTHCTCSLLHSLHWGQNSTRWLVFLLICLIYVKLKCMEGCMK